MTTAHHSVASRVRIVAAVATAGVMPVFVEPEKDGRHARFRDAEASRHHRYGPRDRCRRIGEGCGDQTEIGSEPDEHGLERKDFKKPSRGCEKRHHRQRGRRREGKERAVRTPEPRFPAFDEGDISKKSDQSRSRAWERNKR